MGVCVCKGDRTVRMEREQVVYVCVCVCARVKEENGDDGVEKTLI